MLEYDANGGSVPPLDSLRLLVSIAITMICYGSRKRAIGGWLLYFFWFALGSGSISLIYAITRYKKYFPAGWDDRSLYLWFLASSLPALVAETSLIIAGIALLRTRDWSWVVRIRWILGADIAAALLATMIDDKFFPYSQASRIYGLIPPVVLLLYLFQSKRVRRVFLTKDWEEGIVASYTDRRPRRGIIYTESELEEMRRRGESDR